MISNHGILSRRVALAALVLVGGGLLVKRFGVPVLYLLSSPFKIRGFAFAFFAGITLPEIGESLQDGGSLLAILLGIAYLVVAVQRRVIRRRAAAVRP